MKKTLMLKAFATTLSFFLSADSIAQTCNFAPPGNSDVATFDGNFCGDVCDDVIKLRWQVGAELQDGGQLSRRLPCDAKSAFEVDLVAKNGSTLFTLQQGDGVVDVLDCHETLLATIRTTVPSVYEIDDPVSDAAVAWAFYNKTGNATLEIRDSLSAPVAFAIGNNQGECNQSRQISLMPNNTMNLLARDPRIALAVFAVDELLDARTNPRVESNSHGLSNTAIFIGLGVYFGVAAFFSCVCIGPVVFGISYFRPPSNRGHSSSLSHLSPSSE